jgi:hypothetical protein
VRWLAIDMVIIRNDICSVEKEEQAGGTNNLLLILERTCSRAEAVETACEMIRERLAGYLAAEQTLSALCDTCCPRHEGQSIVTSSTACVPSSGDRGVDRVGL